ncbi:peptidyl-tRNA hydrolase [Candidatus Woesearchaeota archaeon]|nr:peptidyl-tRNA hydrolase [Candidatus Woesearchaeota archaeon]
MELKQVILMRADLRLPKGKMAAQAAHAAAEAALRSGKEALKAWRAAGQKKVVLKVADEKELHRYNQLLKDAGITTAVITDAGRTVIAPGTVTCLGAGPDEEEKIDRITGTLKMM